MVKSESSLESSRRIRPRPVRLNTGITLSVSFILMCVIFTVLTGDFASWANIKNIMRTLSVVGVVAIGETLVLLAGGVDISVGSVAAMAGVVASMLWGAKIGNVWVCAGAGLLAGSLVGLINGLVITRLKINPLITTLGTFSIVRGLSFAFANGQMNQIVQPDFQFIGRGDVAGIPFSLILMAVLYIVFIFGLSQTRAGRNIYAVGGNAPASRLAGIPASRYLLAVYIISGLFAAVGGLILASQVAAGTPQAAAGLEFKVNLRRHPRRHQPVRRQGHALRHVGRRLHPAHPRQRPGPDRRFVLLARVRRAARCSCWPSASISSACGSSGNRERSKS